MIDQGNQFKQNIKNLALPFKVSCKINYSGRWTSFLGAGGKLARVLGFGVVDSLLKPALHVQLLSHHEHLVPWPGFAPPACLEEVVIGCMAVPGGVLLAQDRLLVERHGLVMSLAQVASVGVEIDVPSWSGGARGGARVDHVHQASIVLVHRVLQQSVVYVQCKLLNFLPSTLVAF